ncbi:MAG: LytTR family transcriptional regulator DNA-binding domain-containing protein [Flavobacteriales bacterium]|nr:LytTR family transcriptional regulator DNA-binding domain-containing protein [Flavobacteriales bacterium]
MSSLLKAIIVEDELLARKRLKKLLLPYADKIEIIGEASNGKVGLSIIEELRPDFIFLDIQMPVLDGFEMLSKLSFQPYIVFTTAYDEYALKAFEQNSIDFLLKPIQAERIKITMDKIISFGSLKDNSNEEIQKLQDLISYIQKPKSIKSIRVNIGNRIIILDLDEVAYFKAEDKLTTIVTMTDKEYLFNPSLAQLEQKLPDHFIRLNRSHIINENKVSEIRKGINSKLSFEMKNKSKTKIYSGSSYTSDIKARWKL